MIPKINSKMSFDGGIGGVNNKPSSRNPGILDQVSRAYLVIGLYEDGIIRSLKDRTASTTSLYRNMDLEDVISKTSFMISKRVFEKNDLKIFQEGLKGEIEIAIKETIEKFHTQRG